MVRGRRGRCQGRHRAPPPRPGLGCSQVRGQGDAAGPDPPQRIERPGSARGAQSDADRCTSRRCATFCSDSRPREPARPRPASCLHSLHSMPTCEAHRRPERHWHANWYDPELRSLIARSVRRYQPCPDAYVQGRRGVTPAEWGPRERQWPENSLTFHSSGSGRRTST
jgi:hypothetical protein